MAVAAKGTAVRWWTVPLWQRAFMMAVVWTILAVGVVFFAVSMCMLVAPGVTKEWGQIVGSVFYLGFAYLAGRNWLIGVAVAEEGLIVCAIFPGRAERIPFADVQWCRAGSWWMRKWLNVKTRRLIPLWFHNDRSPLPSRWSIKDWDEMLAALQRALEPLGKWRV